MADIMANPARDPVPGAGGRACPGAAAPSVKDSRRDASGREPRAAACPHRPARVLADLARAKGVATEYWDWQGRHVVVPGETIVAVLRGPRRRRLRTTPPRPRPGRRRRTGRGGGCCRRWSSCREGWTPWVPVHVPHGDAGRGLGRPGGRRPPRRCAQVDHWVAAAGDRRRAGRRGDVRAARRPAARAGTPLAARHDGRHDRHGPLVVTPAWLELPAALAGRPRVGA